MFSKLCAYVGLSGPLKTLLLMLRTFLIAPFWGSTLLKQSQIFQNWSHVISYVNKALATPDFAEGTMKGVDHANLLTGLNCAYGLAELATRKYKSAAKRFLMAQLDHCNIPDIMSAQVKEILSFLSPLILGRSYSLSLTHTHTHARTHTGN